MVRQYRSSSGRESYSHQIRRPLNSLAFVLPLLAIYHIGAYYYQDYRLLVPRYVDWVLLYFGAPQAFLGPAIIVGFLLVQHMVRRDPTRLHGWTLAGTLAESIASVIPLVILFRLSGWIALPFAQLTQPADHHVPAQLVISVGAGIYEEFVFRLLYIWLVKLVLFDIIGVKRPVPEVLAVISGAVLFALCHFTWAQLGGQAPFDLARFVFLTLAGMAWGTLLVTRGFGVAVGSHVIWDLYATLAQGTG